MTNNLKMPKPVSTGFVPLANLILDTQNPRFGQGDIKTEKDILKRLSEGGNLEELMQSFRENGYYEAEPILVIREKNGSSDYIVIEGNRRVAALKILLNPALKKEFGFEDEKLGKKIEEQLRNRIPIQEYASREVLWSYLGFRHIKGAMPWDSYSKALYLLSVYETYQTPLEEIAERIGDKNSTVYKMFNGIRVLRQAVDAEFIKPEQKKNFPFSHLYTLLGYDKARKYLGIKQDSKGLFPKKPVPSRKIKNLGTVINLVYGDEAGKNKVIISQNPDLRKLNAVLGSPKALTQLLNDTSKSNALDNAYSLTKEAGEVLGDLVLKAYSIIKEASGNLYHYKGDKKILDE